MKHLLRLCILALLVLAPVGSLAKAEPLPQDVNLLQNPGFENPFSQQCCHTEAGLSGLPYAEVQVAAGWTAWWVEPDSNPNFPSYCDYNIKPPSCQPYHRPEYGPAYPYGERIRSGGNAQKYFTFFSTHLAGLYQQVTGVTPGQVYRFSIYIETWSTSADKGFTSAGQPNMGVQIGIDPNGGTDAFSPAIVWSPSQSAFDNWTLFSVDAGAQSSTITVFTRSWPQLALKHDDVYLDDASLSPTGSIAQSPTSAPLITTPFAPITAAPALSAIITSTPLPSGEIYYTVQSGDTLGRIAYVFNTTVDAIRQLNSLKNNLIYPNQKLLVKVVTPEPSATAPPPPTTAPTQTRAPETAPTIPAPATSQTSANYGQLCVVAYNDANHNAVDDNEPSLPGVRITLSVGVTPLDGYVTTGDESTHCFPQLPAGAYTVSVAAPPGYTATTATDTTVTLKAQSLVTLAFGLTSVANAPATGLSSGPADEPLSNTVLILIGVGGFSLITGGLGLAALFWFRKK